jgi:hypothetical protein
VGIAGHCGITCLSEIERLLTADNKLVQLRAAAALGISIPASAVTSDRASIPPELGDLFVAKPLGPGQFDDEHGETRVVFTKELSRVSRELGALGGAPFLLQELVNADEHLRVVTVADRFWVCSLDASGVPLDWRREDRAHTAFVVRENHQDVGNQALALARRLGVGFSSQDWIVAGDRRFFLDLNPGGQWRFLPEPVASQITSAIARWLAAP